MKRVFEQERLRKDASGMSTINRMCAILNTFNEEQKVLTLSDIGRRINLPKSTTHRLLATLEAQGILMRDSEGRGYRLGYQLIRWGTLAQSSLDLRNLALPILQKLSTDTQETAVLSVIDYAHMAAIWLEQIESPQAVRWVKRVGQRVYLHAGASSKVLWAFLPEEEIEYILNRIELVPIQSSTITDKERMRRELHEIRRRGYAVSIEETDPGAMGVAAPVYDHRNKVVAGIGIIAPISRVPEELIPEVAKTVLDASYQLSRLLGAHVTGKLVAGKEVVGRIG
jgi:DNA-binding IclR family transcriptional regulator